MDLISELQIPPAGDGLFFHRETSLLFNSNSMLAEADLSTLF